jgi:REP element-mobilizing transposase RayT
VVIAHHLIWTAYGAWLPNDLRGSGSRIVLSAKLAALGQAHFGRKRVQPSQDEVRAFYECAEPLLSHPVIRFDATHRAAIAEALDATIRRTPYTCWACAIMPDHVHLVIRKHPRQAEEIIERLQEATRLGLEEKQLIPQGHPAWTDGGWKVFLDSPDAVRSRIRYVENNPLKSGLPRQEWPFVIAYGGWVAG